MTITAENLTDTQWLNDLTVKLWELADVVEYEGGKAGVVRVLRNACDAIDHVYELAAHDWHAAKIKEQSAEISKLTQELAAAKRQLAKIDELAHHD